MTKEALLKDYAMVDAAKTIIDNLWCVSDSHHTESVKAIQKELADLRSKLSAHSSFLD